jgi:hypothetical protein
MTNNDPQSTAQKTKNQAVRTLKTAGELETSVRLSSSCSTSDNSCLTLVTKLQHYKVISHEGDTKLL